MKKVVVIVGPTGSGKTRLSIELAKRFGLEIINGDSVQVYDELSIGSAKVKTEEMEGVPHHLLGHIPVSEPYSVYHFQREARKAIESIERPAIVGGTGLYIKAALFDYTLVTVVGVPNSNVITRTSNEELYQKLYRKESEYHG